MNDASSTAGACTPTVTTTIPSTAASEYAGAVEAMPMISPSTKPIASFFSPCSLRSGACTDDSI
jgi:hypothetical protein